MARGKPDTTTTTKALAARIDHVFVTPALLDRAVTHRGTPGIARNGAYERLEFLGDRVLGLVIADLLLDRFPDEAEGALARRHAALVRRETLADVARALDLGAALVLSKGEEDAGGRDNPAILADACEAVIGALYRDGGLDVARRFIHAHWVAAMEAGAAKPPKDAKTALQEWAQGAGLPLPAYRVLETAGPPHDPVFTIEAAVSGHPPARARGGSKRRAEQDAARTLLAAVTAATEVKST